MEFHPSANIFPMIDESQLQELSEDIQKNGLVHPILTHDGMILDGRNRFKACEQAGVEPRFAKANLNGHSPTELVLSLNLHRRHLDESQRSMVAGRAIEQFKREAKERQQKSGGDRKSNSKKIGSGQLTSTGRGQSRDKAGEAVNVSGASVQRAVAVLKNGSQALIHAVDEGKVSVTKAAKVAREVPKAKQMNAIQSPAATPKSKSRGRANQLVGRRDLDRLVSLVSELGGLVDKPSLEISIVHVKQTTKQLLNVVSKLKEYDSV